MHVRVIDVDDSYIAPFGQHMLVQRVSSGTDASASLTSKASMSSMSMPARSRTRGSRGSGQYRAARVGIERSGDVGRPATVIRHGGAYHRFTKDERPDVMHVFHEISPDLFRATTDAVGSAWDLVAERIGSDHVTHGEGPIVVPSNNDERWFLLLDWPPYGGGTGYVLFETDDLGSGHRPFRKRAGRWSGLTS